MTPEELMNELGFDCLGPSPQRDGTKLWLLSYGAHDILVVLPERVTNKEVAEAIHDAGARDKRDEINGRWKAFTEAVRLPSVDTTWEEARRLQREQREQREQATSMPHPADIHADGSPDDRATNLEP